MPAVRFSFQMRAATGGPAYPPLRSGGGGPPKAVEGGNLLRKFLCHTHDCICCFIKALHQIGSRNPHQGDASRSQPRAAPQITRRSAPHIVTQSIDLDGEPCLRAIEVDHIRSNRVLPAKHRLCRPASFQATPQPRLWQRQIAAKPAGFFNRSCWGSHARHLLTERRGCPLHHASHGSPPPFYGGG
jgi:hypothetical protein